jgi:ATP-dependent Zn protease
MANSDNSSYYNFSMIIVNFVCILILYILVMYLFNKYMDIDEKVSDAIGYQISNDRQLSNLVQDINYNDKHITDFIHAKHSSS